MSDIPDKIYIPYNESRGMCDEWNLADLGEQCVEYTRTPQWQPIETAPRDWERIVIYNGIEVGCGYYCTYRNDFEWVGEGMQVIPPATHWMPLPTLPKEQP